MRRLLPLLSVLLVILVAATGCAGAKSGPPIAQAQEPTATASPGASAAAETPAAKAWLGIQVTNITPALVKRLTLFRDKGAVITEVVKDSPAAEANFRVGDVILAMGGKEVSTAKEVVAIVQESQPGTKLTVKVLRGKDELTLEPTLGTKPAPQPPVTPPLIPELAGIPLSELFSHVTGGQLTITDKDGKPVTLTLRPGTVTALTADSVTVALNDKSGDAAFTITAKTAVFRNGVRGGVRLLSVGAKVVVVTVGDSREASVILVTEGLNLMPFRQQLQPKPQRPPQGGPEIMPFHPQAPFVQPNFQLRDLLNGASHGTVKELTADGFTLETPSGVKPVVITDDTAILGQGGKLSRDAITAGAQVVVMGKPRDDGAIVARYVALVPAGLPLDRLMPRLKEFLERGGGAHLPGVEGTSGVAN